MKYLIIYIAETKEVIVTTSDLFNKWDTLLQELANIKDERTDETSAKISGRKYANIFKAKLRFRIYE